MRITSLIMTAAIVWFSSVASAQVDSTQSGKQSIGSKSQDREKGESARRNAGKQRGNPQPNAIFIRLDKNKDSMLSADEVPERMHARLKRMDGDSNGTVSKDEFLMFFKKRMNGASNKSAIRPRKDGKNAANRVKGKAKSKSASDVIKRIDSDDDGRLSIDEAPEKMKNKFAMIDSNGDDFVDEQELQSAMERMKSKVRISNRYDTDPETSKGQIPKRPPFDG